MASPHVRDATTADFGAQVIERSKTVPILVDFWAEWCGPCRMLGPVLERIAREADGAFELVKVDTDANPELAMQYQIRGIPAVKLFAGGEVAGEFVGALPEPAVRAFLKEHLPSEADELASEAVELITHGQRDDARERLERALELEPTHAAAHLALARIGLATRDLELLEEHVAAIPPLADEAEVGRYIRQAGELLTACDEAGGEQACRDRLSAQPDDLDARFALGACLTAQGQYREALDEFLAVVAKDKKHRDEAARKAMLTVFGLLGIRSDLSDEYRRKLSVYL